MRGARTAAAGHPAPWRSTPAFVGALLPVCGADVLIVAVRPWILDERDEARLYVAAFAQRFQRTIVLMAQDDQRVPTYYGPASIVLALRVLPFEIIPWRRIPYRPAPPRRWQLPIPPEPPPVDSTARWATAASLPDAPPTVPARARPHPIR